jgi:hypothetical protein
LNPQGLGIDSAQFKGGIASEFPGRIRAGTTTDGGPLSLWKRKRFFNEPDR